MFPTVSFMPSPGTSSGANPRFSLKYLLAHVVLLLPLLNLGFQPSRLKSIEMLLRMSCARKLVRISSNESGEKGSKGFGLGCHVLAGLGLAGPLLIVKCRARLEAMTLTPSGVSLGSLKKIKLV